MKAVKTIMVRLYTGLAVLALLSGCAVEAKRIDAQTLEAITETGYFTLSSRNETGRYGPVVILPERHNSRLIQAEQAYLMDMLAESGGLARVALEGMFTGETFDGIVFPGAAEPERTRSLLWLLESGEITAPEFMYLEKNFRVFGIENPEEYRVDLPARAGISLDIYSLASVFSNKRQEIPDLAAAFDRLNTARDAETYQRYFNEILALDPWTKEHYETITHESSTGEVKKSLRELLNKVEPYRGQLGIPGEAREGLLEYIRFMEAVEQRSATMSRAVQGELRKNNGVMVMVIGAAHTEDVEQYFAPANISYYVFEPDGLEPGAYASDLTGKEYSRKLEQKSVLMDGEIFRILEQEKKPQHTLGEVWLENDFSLAALLGTAARVSLSAGPPLTPLGGDLKVGNFSVLPGSITKLDDHTVMFQISNGREELYVKMAENTAVEAWSVNLRTALGQIIDSLRRQEYRITEETVRAFKLNNYAVVMGPGYEAVLNHAITVTR
ncbi:MAG: hypothetical protein LBP80_05670 [Treponema sp.]|jgi:hypothetical protein|nr:hypothetical protein [Treponema sp.]